MQLACTPGSSHAGSITRTIDEVAAAITSAPATAVSAESTARRATPGWRVRASATKVSRLSFLGL